MITLTSIFASKLSALYKIAEQLTVTTSQDLSIKTSWSPYHTNSSATKSSLPRGHFIALFAVTAVGIQFVM